MLKIIENGINGSNGVFTLIEKNNDKAKKLKNITVVYHQPNNDKDVFDKIIDFKYREEHLYLDVTVNHEKINEALEFPWADSVASCMIPKTGVSWIDEHYGVAPKDERTFFDHVIKNIKTYQDMWQKNGITAKARCEFDVLMKNTTIAKKGLNTLATYQPFWCLEVNKILYGIVNDHLKKDPTLLNQSVTEVVARHDENFETVKIEYEKDTKSLVFIWNFSNKGYKGFPTKGYIINVEDTLKVLTFEEVKKDAFTTKEQKSKFKIDVDEVGEYYEVSGNTQIRTLNYYAGPSSNNLLKGSFVTGEVFKSISKEVNYIQHELGWSCSDYYFEKEKINEIYLTKIYSEVLWRVTHPNGLYYFYDHTVYTSHYGHMGCGDILCESKTWTDKNGDIWIGHYRGWSQLYHAETKTYYMKKVNKDKNDRKFGEEHKQLFNGTLSIKIFKDEESPETILSKILENKDHSNKDKLEFFNEFKNAIKDDEEKIKIQIKKFEKLKETLESVLSKVE